MIERRSSPGTPLIGALELAEMLDAPTPPVLLDVRWKLGDPGYGRRAYDAGHLPGSVFCDLETVLSGPPGGQGRHPLPDPQDVGAWFRSAGVRTAVPVCVYDEKAPLAAARAWWMLRYLGHPAVKVLDGGIEAWAARGLPVTSEPAHPTPGDFIPRPDPSQRLTADTAAALTRTGVLLDARARERYTGEVEPVDPIGGHIPGAVSAPFTDTVAADGTMRPIADLVDLFRSRDATPDRPVGVYCGSGVTAAAEVLALDLAGIPARLFVESWSGWVADGDRPVARGAEPGGR